MGDDSVQDVEGETGGRSADGTERSVCKIRGCLNDPHENGYCEDCLNDMAHAALDLAGVP